MRITAKRLASHIPHQDSYIVASKRTPFGAYGGKLRELKASELGGIAGKAALAELPQGVKVDQVFFGNVTQTDNSTPYLARHVGHLSGLDSIVPALTINRLCGSGFQTAITAAQHIALGEAEVCLTGGVEAMSMSPYTLSGLTRYGSKYGVDLKLEDSLAAALVDQNPGGHKTPMGITAENLAKKYNITRDECDAFALMSQQRYADGLAAGAFTSELTPVTLKPIKGVPQSLEADEHPRPQSTLASLQKLPSVFIKGSGVVTAGNASGICDGAAANVLMSEEAVNKYGVRPLARIASYAWSACEPEIMGIGPVVAVREALKKVGKSVGEMDIIELNEAFAAQWLAVQKELELPSEKTNMFGGAIAVGHPLAASGARILANLTHNLHRLDKQWALGTACIGGGQGIAVVLERC
ncbi:acetyl-CoA acyltransferase 2 [Cryptococcus deuterogattii 99/473]|uniref:Unplaced genomic scaffold supercont1.3, whole genome shotgun sequence n=1 Tax=Cryptococcus deuterogattii Ram5 TaxID=1296110 RepID=A0A0D0VBU4_9TREE|nr:acetyl-CoA acyltransferase 2 [Cryptococcus deuterogattii MMRL2647]KIR42290.1 acetyl-CoA acyltransferase 2 [Cryptococcus deuterogattii Ram5]KIR72885.1 acetyl-CoA acyltransferase 2 [Cryptococcus deuterogattii CA1014]KIY59695.1 acetyl-CoA acyltransferase 2 [Cryptococcus deuterogattii 99/473]